MIFGIGIDILEIDRLNRGLSRFGDRFVKRILTQNEILQFELRKQSLRYLASRFAAKEAVSKALGTGMANGVGFHSIEVTNNKQGKPEVVLHDIPEHIIDPNQHRIFLSLSDEKQYVTAMAVIERI